MRKLFVAVPIVLLVLSLAAGCVSNQKFEEAVADVTTRVDDVQSQVERHGEQIDQLEAKDEELAGDIGRVDSRVGEVAETSASALQTAQEAKQVARGKVIWQVTLTNDDIRFGVDNYKLADGDQSALDQLVQKVKSFDRTVYLEIQGHTDSTGSETYNEMLGRKRAEAVRSYLYKAGLPLHLMEVVSYGESNPVADNSTAEGRAQNRRVEVLVLE